MGICGFGISLAYCRHHYSATSVITFRRGGRYSYRIGHGIYSGGGRLQLFDWDDANLDHITEHGIEPEEAEEAVLDPARVSRTAYTVDGERRYVLVGVTEDGRHVFVVATRRSGATRVISARDATDREKRVYRTREK